MVMFHASSPFLSRLHWSDVRDGGCLVLPFLSSKEINNKSCFIQDANAMACKEIDRIDDLVRSAGARVL